MSIAIISKELWLQIYTDCVSAHINRGMSLSDARVLTIEAMQESYRIANDGTIQKDIDEERANDWTR